MLPFNQSFSTKKAQAAQKALDKSRKNRDCVKTEARSLTCKLPFDDPPGPLGTKLSAGQLWRLKVEDEFLSSYDIEHSFDIVCEIDQRDFTGNILEAA